MSEPEIELQSEEVVGEAAAEIEIETTDANIVVNDSKQQEQRQQQSSPLSPSTSVGEVPPDPEAFVNNGLRNWQTAREAWCEKLTTTNGETTTSKNKAAVELDVDGVIDVLFDPRWRGGGGKARMSLQPPRFPTNVPLPQMIDVLTDLWEAEGLDV